MDTRSILKIVVVVVLLGTPSMGVAVEDMWTRKADMPTKRLGLSTSVVNGKIYAIGGGKSIEGTAFRTVEAYDPVTDTWTKEADMLTRRYFHSASVVNKKVYIIGGAIAEMVTTPIVEKYDPATSTWTRKADMPTARCFFCTSVVNGKIYAIGGRIYPGDFSVSTVEEYDPTTDTWTTKADMPTARAWHATGTVDEKIYALGGVSGSLFAASLPTVEEYDPATDTWTRKADMPTGRKGLSASVVAERIYAIGGWELSSLDPSPTVEQYDPATDTWTTKADMPIARSLHSSSMVNEKIYAVGGSVRFPPHDSISIVHEYDAGLTARQADFNGDGSVDGKDVLILAEHWGRDDPICDIAPPPFGDGLVDLQDLIALADSIGKEVNDPTLVAHWALDEAEGTVACDSAGENDGTILGVPRWQPEGGQVGGALEFDGTYFVVADAALSPADGPFSVLAWIKGGGPGQAIISQVGGVNWLMADASGLLMTELRGSSRLSKVLSSDAIITDGHWHRVGFTWDGYTRSLGVDDVPVAEDRQTGLADCYGDLNIGCGKDITPDTFWTGLIEDVRIYHRAVKP